MLLRRIRVRKTSLVGLLPTGSGCSSIACGECRTHVDDVDVLNELLVLLHTTLPETNSQMSDAVMGSVNDGLVMSQHVQVVAGRSVIQPRAWGGGVMLSP